MNPDKTSLSSTKFRMNKTSFNVAAEPVSKLGEGSSLQAAIMSPAVKVGTISTINDKLLQDVDSIINKTSSVVADNKKVTVIEQPTLVKRTLRNRTLVTTVAGVQHTSRIVFKQWYIVDIEYFSNLKEIRQSIHSIVKVEELQRWNSQDICTTAQ